MTRFAVLAAVSAALLLPATAAADGGDFELQVVGGYPVSAAQFPWQAAVARAGGGSAFNRQFCGGSLITPSVVLTAAHCVEDTDPDCIATCATSPICVENPPGSGDGTCRIDPEEVEVILGQTTLSTAPAASELAVIDVAFQGDSAETPAYNPSTLENDIGYLVLQNPSAQGQIKLAAATETGLWQPGVFADISGWGTTSSGGSKSDSLRGGSVPIVTDQSCEGSYPAPPAEFHADSMVCAGYMEGGVDTCQGDSGGPLQSPLLGGGYRLIGITSWGIGCAEPNRPGVYTRLFDDALRIAVVDKIEDDLEVNNPIGDQGDPVGDGNGQPRGGVTFPKQAPPPPPDGFVPSTPQTVVDTAEPRDPFAKCRKIPKKTRKQRKKRKTCVRKVRASL
jgi:trypsin